MSTTIKALMMAFFIIMLYFNNGIQGMETILLKNNVSIQGIDSEAILQNEGNHTNVVILFFFKIKQSNNFLK